MLAAWFPASSLLHQHQALNATNAKLAELRQQDQALAKEQKLLNNPAEIARIAREQYQLVSPGQRAYEVLPANGATSAPDHSGDPGQQPLVSPSAASDLGPGALSSSGTSGHGSSSTPATSHGTTATGASTPTASTHGTAAGSGHGTSGQGSAGTPGFLGRIVRTLEFWR